VVPVLAGTVSQKDIPVQLLAIGKVEAYASVSIKIRVTGELTQVHFREGQEVKKGDLLFTIDPRPYQAALDERRPDWSGIRPCSPRRKRTQSVTPSW